MSAQRKVMGFVTGFVATSKAKKRLVRAPNPVNLTKVREAAKKKAAERLAGFDPASMPWLAPEVDFTPPDGSQERQGPETYTPPSKGRRSYRTPRKD